MYTCLITDKECVEKLEEKKQLQLLCMRKFYHKSITRLSSHNVYHFRVLTSDANNYVNVYILTFKLSHHKTFRPVSSITHPVNFILPCNIKVIEEKMTIKLKKNDENHLI